jgi:hypothetical protein
MGKVFGSQMRLAVTRRGMTRCVKVAWQKENFVGRNCARAMVERATQRVVLLRKNLQTHHEVRRGTTTEAASCHCMGKRRGNHDRHRRVELGTAVTSEEGQSPTSRKGAQESEHFWEAEEH